MKKTVLGIMLIIGTLSFSNDRADRGEKNSYKWQEATFFKQEQPSDEHISRDTQKVANEEFSEIVLFNDDRGSDRN